MKILLACLLLISTSAFAFESIQVGPSVKLIDVPHPAQVGIEARLLDGYLGLSLHKGFMPAIDVDKYNVKLDNMDVGVKFHPWQGSFYVGVLMGNQEVVVKGSEEIQNTNVDFEAKVKSTYVTPHIGWQWRFNSGVFLGMHLGWQISSGAKTSLTHSPNDPILQADPEYQQTKKDIEDQGNQIGNTSLPNVGLLQIGYMF